MHTNLPHIVSHFPLPGDYLEGRPYGQGHINDTYKITLSQAGTYVNYLLQRINNEIFTDVPALMENIERVCTHAQAKLAAQNRSEPSRRSLTLMPTRQGRAFYQDELNQYWRMYLFVERAIGYDIVQTPQQAREAAKAFGAFQHLLMDLPGKRLNETIPNFHNTAWRYRNFEEALASDPHNRAQQVGPEIKTLQAHATWATALTELDLPERVTHNDTKLNNVLIDTQTHEAMCVIDLDTVMPGLALHDFGDLVRTSTSPAAEDEQDLSKVCLRMDMYRALLEGYLSSAQAFLTQTEIDHLPLAGKVITFETALRFLTDYLNGDTYFKIHRDGHNIDRCRTQLALIASMEQQEDAMHHF